MRALAPIALAAFGLGACQSVAPTMPAAADREAHALAQAACAGCHSVEQYGLSSNPAAPEFATIANRDGLTAQTLRTWLTDAHNYPEDMDFYLEIDEVNQLVGYILTLRQDAYEPPIQ